MARHKDGNWNLPKGGNGDPLQWKEHVTIAVLMDVRDELKRLNALLHCPNFTAIPDTLRGIRRKLPSRKERLSRGAK
jgi:hypothetical protein